MQLRHVTHWACAEVACMSSMKRAGDRAAHTHRGWERGFGRRRFEVALALGPRTKKYVVEPLSAIDSGHRTDSSADI